MGTVMDLMCGLDSEMSSIDHGLLKPQELMFACRSALIEFNQTSTF